MNLHKLCRFLAMGQKLQRFILWLAGVQPVRNTRAVLSMVSASDGTRVSIESIIPNHKSLVLTSNKGWIRTNLSSCPEHLFYQINYLTTCQLINLDRLFASIISKGSVRTCGFLTTPRLLPLFESRNRF
jgi:hypothetical protein